MNDVEKDLERLSKSIAEAISHYLLVGVLSSLASEISKHLRNTIVSTDLRKIGLDEDFVNACIEDDKCAETAYMSWKLEEELNKKEQIRIAKELTGLEIIDHDCNDFEAKDGEIYCEGGEVVIKIGDKKVKFSCSEWGFIEVE